MKVKYVNEINKYLNKWLKKHGFECTVMYGLDFSYDFINDMITYSFTVPNDHDKMFLEVCQEVEPRIKNCDNFILSFFHELGHSMTDDDFSNKEHEKYIDFLTKLNEKEKLTKRDYKRYYKNKIELAATQWACDYIITNSKEVEVFAKQVGKLFQKFVKLNDLDKI